MRSTKTIVERLEKIWDNWRVRESYNEYFTSRLRRTFQHSLVDIRESPLLRFLRTRIYTFDSSLLRKEQEMLRLITEKEQTYNETYIHTHKRRYHSFLEGIDDNLPYPLDEDQKRAVLIDDDRHLVVAAAGSGKTSVLTARIAHLVRNCRIRPERILALSFNKHAVNEMKNRLREQYNITHVQTHTFHSLGLSIVKEHGGNSRVVESPTNLLQSLFNDLLKTDEIFQKLVIEYALEYAQQQPSRDQYREDSEYLKALRSQQYRTLSGITVRSVAEKEIANFYTMHNIRFEYEPRAEWVHGAWAYHPDFYLPDFDLYHEHWGLDRNNRVPQWFSKSSREYVAEQKWKREQFRFHKRTLIETWDYERVEGSLLDCLKQRLVKANHKVLFTPIPFGDLVKKLRSQETLELIKLATTVITHAKSNFITPEQLKQKVHSGTFAKKSQHFGAIVLILYQVYEAELRTRKEIDFNDMINHAIELLDRDNQGQTGRYDYILVDEFQDISNQRLQLINRFVNESSNTKLFCVGDDWQSINKFAGGEVEYFVNFERYFPDPTVSVLKANYRSSQTIVDASTKVISYNKLQRQKSVCASNNVRRPIIIARFPSYVSSGAVQKIQCDYVLEEILNLTQSGVSDTDIMVLSRFNYPLQHLQNIAQASPKRGLLKNIRYMSIHRSKGAEAKYVFILGLVSGPYGFPSEIQDDRVLEIIKPPPQTADIFEEERRLFYVAITRSKEFLRIITHKDYESIFLSELPRKHITFQTIPSKFY